MFLRWKEHYLKIVILSSFLIGCSTTSPSKCKPPDDTQYNVTEKDLCNVCDDECEKGHAYFGGDHVEHIRFSSKGYFYSFIAIIPPQDENVCYFCISYYNQSTKSYTLDGTLMISKSPMIKNNKTKWTIKHDSDDDIIRKYNNGTIYVYSVISESDLQEGHYKFQFNNNTELHQYYLKKNREKRRRSWFRNDGLMKSDIDDEIISSTWNDVPTIFGKGAERPTKMMATWNIYKIDMSPQFLNCLDWNHTHYEYGLKSYAGCQLHRNKDDVFQNMKCKLNNNTDVMKMEIMAHNSSNKLSIPKKVIRVDIMCATKSSERRRPIYGFVQPVLLQYSADIHSTSEIESAGSSGTMAGIIVIALVVFMVLTICLVFYYRKKSKKKQLNTISNVTPSNIKWEENPNYSESDSSDDVDGDPLLPKWLLDRNEMIYDTACIEKGRRLGGGNFGDVFEGKIRLGNAVYPVAIKTPKKSTNQEVVQFLEEIKTMLEFDTYHENIVNLQGISYKKENHGGDCIIKCSLILEYCSMKNLRSYLIDHESEFKRSLEFYENNKFLDPLPSAAASNGIPHDIQLLYRWTFQVANGMQFLMQKHIHHGDLAARNILLTDGLVAKISDFGLSRRLYEDISEPQPVVKPEDGCETVPLILPMKWLALEVLLHKKITHEKSDVWSFGVLTWEIFQLGTDPYRKGIQLEQLIYELKSGVRLPAPESCTPPISTIIQKCFLEQPTERPSFSEIKNSLEHAYFALQGGPTTRIVIESPDEEPLHYPDLLFEERYLNMRKENQQYRENNNMSAIKTQQEVDVATASVTSSFKNGNSHYLSVKDMSSSRIQICSDVAKRKTTQPFHHDFGNASTDQNNETDFRSKFVLSPGSSGHKRFFSFSGFDPTPPLQLERFSTSMKSGKSYPNHLYMMFLSDSKTHGSSERGSLKEEIQMLKTQT